jgi:hypothetical protein
MRTPLSDAFNNVFHRIGKLFLRPPACSWARPSWPHVIICDYTRFVFSFTPRRDRPPRRWRRMASMRRNPSTTYMRQEQLLMKRLVRTRKLFGFLRAHRHELLDEAFEAELEAIYRATGAGKEPVPPPRCSRWRRCCRHWHCHAHSRPPSARRADARRQHDGATRSQRTDAYDRCLRGIRYLVLDRDCPGGRRT